MLADHRPLLEPVTGEPGGVHETLRVPGGPDERVVIRAHLVEARPAGADAELRQRGQSAGRDRGERLERLLAPAERERRALAVEVEAGAEVDRQRQLAREG